MFGKFNRNLYVKLAVSLVLIFLQGVPGSSIARAERMMEHRVETFLTFTFMTCSYIIEDPSFNMNSSHISEYAENYMDIIFHDRNSVVYENIMAEDILRINYSESANIPAPGTTTRACSTYANNLDLDLLISKLVNQSNFRKLNSNNFTKFQNVKIFMSKNKNVLGFWGIEGSSEPPASNGLIMISTTDKKNIIFTMVKIQE